MLYICQALFSLLSHASTSIPLYVSTLSHTYKVVEIVGSSPNSTDEAIRNAIAEAGKTLRHLDWFEVTQVRGYIRDGAVDHYQVTLKIGSRLKDA